MSNKLIAAQLAQDPSYRLELALCAGQGGLHREIGSARIQKPGLALAGYLAQIKLDRVQILGQTEMSYLESLGEEAPKRVEALLSLGVVCVIVTAGVAPPLYLRQLADQLQIPVFATPLLSSLFIERITGFLRGALAERTSTHGVLVDVNGVGILIVGKSGIGKSECALDLIIRGYRLVADDLVEIAKLNDGILVGRAAELTKHLMEVRGLGIINIKDLFGVASVREEKRIELVVELVEWSPDEEYDRAGLDEERRSFLGVEIPFHRLPVRPGRNMTSIIEIAAKNHLLKLQGHHSAREFQQKLERELAAPTPPRPFRGKVE